MPVQAAYLANYAATLSEEGRYLRFKTHDLLLGS
jgi:hypothetical protein